MIVPYAAQTHGRWLSAAERQVLLDLFAVRPRLTSGQIQLALQDRTGRTISTAQICRNRHKADRLGKSTYFRRHLSEAERLVLNRICRHAAPAFHVGTIAERFAAETGRKIARKSVYRFLESRLAIPMPTRSRKVVAS